MSTASVGRCSSGVPVAAAATLIVFDATSCQVDTTFGVLGAMVTGALACPLPPPSPPPPQPAEITIANVAATSAGSGDFLDAFMCFSGRW